MTEKNVSHTKWMKRAIFLASLGKNTTSPNPRVGAVILDKHGNLISEGFHFRAGMPHAEAMAFKNLDKNRPLRLSLSGVFSELPVPPFVVKEWRSIN